MKKMALLVLLVTTAEIAFASEAEVRSLNSYEKYSSLLQEIKENRTKAKLVVDGPRLSFPNPQEEEIVKKHESYDRTAALAAFRNNTSIEELTWDWDCMHKEAGDFFLKGLFEGLTTNTSLKSLILGGFSNVIGLEQVLKANTSLSSLQLHGTLLPANRKIKGFFKTLGENKSLKSLKIYHESMGATLPLLGDALAVNNTLTSLTLRSVTFSTRALKEFSKSLALNTSLTSLDLFGCTFDEGDAGVDDSGTQAFAQALVKNSTIRNIILNDCKISLNGAIALAEMLVENRSIEQFDLPCITIRNTQENVVEARKNFAKKLETFESVMQEVLAKNKSITAIRMGTENAGRHELSDQENLLYEEMLKRLSNLDSRFQVLGT